jgi:hypothetical protein
MSILKLWRTEMSLPFQSGEINNEITDRDSHARPILLQPENSKWQILDRKM